MTNLANQRSSLKACAFERLDFLFVGKSRFEQEKGYLAQWLAGTAMMAKDRYWFNTE